MYFAIDRVPLNYPPDTIDIIANEVIPYQFVDGRNATVDPGGCVTVNINYEGVIAQAAVLELHNRRMHYGLHTITFEDTRVGRLVTMNAYMPPVTQRYAQYDNLGHLSFAAFTVPFKQVNPLYDIVCMDMWRRGEITVPVPEACKITLPFRCQFANATARLRSVGTGGNNFWCSVFFYTTRPDNDYPTDPWASLRYMSVSSDPLDDQMVVPLDGTGLGCEGYPGDLLVLNIDTLPGANNPWDLNVKVWLKAYRP